VRRDLKAILAAHIIDPNRRELYVEGSRDKLFLEWTLGENKSEDAIIVLIDFVDVPDVEEGGNKERLLTFLRSIDGKAETIRGLIDADADHLRPEKLPIPSNVWVTDWRSLESYVLTVECLDAALRLGCGIDSIKAEDLFPVIVSIARRVSAIRFVSESDNLQLPVSAYKWIKYVKSRPRGGVALDLRGMLTALMQSAGVGLSRLDAIERAVSEAEQTFAEAHDLHVVHGKDFMKILGIQLKAADVEIDDAGRLLWTTFRRENVALYPVLSEVVSFLMPRPSN
jgi:hypothetical protein